MNTDKIIMPILGFVAVISLLDLQQKCMRDGNAFSSEIEVMYACDACQCCVGCIDIQNNEANG